MSKKQAKLERFVFEVRFGYGHTYFDRCGQTLVDIEKRFENWVVANAPDHSSGTMERIDKPRVLEFSQNRFSYVVDDESITNPTTCIDEASALWAIIKGNLGLTEFNRIACRYYYILPVKTIEEGEKRLEKSPLNVIIPDDLNDLDVRNRNITTVFEDDESQYRLQLNCVTRTRSIDPSNLVKGDPRALPKNQRALRLEKFKQVAKYNADPMYAVQLDVDLVQFDPERIAVKSFIEEQHKIVTKRFLPILEAI